MTQRPPSTSKVFGSSSGFALQNGSWMANSSHQRFASGASPDSSDSSPVAASEQLKVVPRIVSRAKAGKLRRIGDGSNQVDSVYIDDAAEAHVQAAAVLEPGSAVAGRAYFVTQDESVPCWDLINGILEAAGVPPLTKSVSKRVAYAAGWTLERYYRMFKPEDEPPMTRFVAMQLSTTHTFDISAAKRDFGYAPQITIAEGLARLKKSFEDQAACAS